MDTHQIAKLLRYYSLLSTTKAGSGHPTSCLSSADLMAVLYFQFFKYDFENPKNIYNDRLIFSKGHAAPLLYSLYKLADLVSEEELLTLRQSTSPLQGHPTAETPYTDVATGSLGMGLSFGLGMAMASQMDKIDNHVYVLLGDGEMAEGNIWEAMEIAAHYKLNNLIGILDVNRLAETGETLHGHNTEEYVKKAQSFGWNTISIDGHDHAQISNALTQAQTSDHPTMIIAKTLKGKGVSLVENKEGKHGKALKHEELDQAIKELNISPDERELIFEVAKPAKNKEVNQSVEISDNAVQSAIQKILDANEPFPTRKAYGTALAELVKEDKNIIVMDGDLSDSTFSGLAEKERPEQFLNMFIAEQNLVAAAVGLSKMGKTVFASTFAAFFTRAYDQIRMASLSEANIKLCGSHSGVSVGEDGASQMGMEDIAMMRSIYQSTILYPSDAVSAVKLVAEALNNQNITYLRTTRPPLEVIYQSDEEFPIGGSKILKSSKTDVCTVIAAGVTVHEAIKAAEKLKNDNINIRVIDAYSVKPIDESGLKKAATETNNKVIVVEDHYFEGGLGDAVLNVYASEPTQVHKMAITERPHSGKGSELLDQYGISAENIVAKVRSLM